MAKSSIISRDISRKDEIFECVTNTDKKKENNWLVPLARHITRSKRKQICVSHHP